MYTIAGLCIYIYMYIYIYIYIYICMYIYINSFALSLHHQPAVYIMIQCTEPVTPAVIVFCEFPVSLQEAVLGLKTLTPIIREERGLPSAVASRVVLTLWKTADQKKKDRRKQYSGRRRQMQADSDRQTVS